MAAALNGRWFCKVTPANFARDNSIGLRHEQNLNHPGKQSLNISTQNSASPGQVGVAIKSTSNRRRKRGGLDQLRKIE
jgi:hypothetical protein